MNELYAAAPECCSNAQNLYSLLRNFGPDAGRYLAKLPDSWGAAVERSCGHLKQTEQAKIATLLRRAEENWQLISHSKVQWRDDDSWVSNFLQLVSRHPKLFEKGIVASDLNDGHCLAFNELELPLTAEEAIATLPHEYVRVSSTILNRAHELIFVDPYMNPCKVGYRKNLSAMFRAAIAGRCKKITCWAREKNVVGEKNFTLSDVKNALSEMLHEIGWGGERQFSFKLVDDGQSTKKMHTRLLLSIKGGIRFDQGFGTVPKGHKNDVMPLGESRLIEYLRIFHEGGHDMRVMEIHGTAV